MPRESAVLSCPQPGDDLWWNGFGLPILNGGPLTVLVDSTDLIVGGGFSGAPGSPATNVARWNGSTWSALGTGLLPPLWCNALVKWNGHLIAGCLDAYSLPGPLPIVYEYDGATWNPLGVMALYTNSVPQLNALAVYNGDLIAGGSFDHADGDSVGCVARWTGTRWQPLGANFPVGYALSLEVYNNHLVASGSFRNFDEVAQWNGITWSALGAGLQNSSGQPGIARALRALGGYLYASGDYGEVGRSGDVQFWGLPRWDGTSWSSLGVSSSVIESQSLGVFNGDLVASSGGNRFARWDGEWVSLEDHSYGDVTGLTQWGTDLVAVGDFGIMRLSGSTWSTNVADWVPGTMAGLASTGVAAVNWHGHLIVAGGGGAVGAQDHFVYTTGVESWDGSSWTSVGANQGYGNVSSMTVWNDQIVVGLAGRSIDGIYVHDIARWDGSAWGQFGAGLSDWPFAVAVYNGDLVALGSFSRSGTTAMSGAARWDGSAWQPLGSGFNTANYLVPNCALQYGPDLIAAGNFAVAGGVPASNIARWDGSAWHSFGGGLDGQGLALAVYGSDLVVGGAFTHAGGIPVGGVARWDGTSWSAMGKNAVEVQALGVIGGRLFAAGSFLCQDASEISTVALWNGQSWTLLGSGFSPGGFSFIEDWGGDLYVGGFFGWANGRSSFNIARWSGLGLVDVPRGGTALQLALRGPRPNPSSGEVVLEYELPTAARARLAIYDLSGRRVATVADGLLQAGFHAARWSGLDNGGRHCRAGVYLARLESATGVRTVKLIRMR
jgi:hypothetical protein